jgi:hypothetical protein
MAYTYSYNKTDMNYLQETTADPGKIRTRLLSIFYGLNFVALIITFALNFLGLPALKYFYLVHVAITIFAIVLFNFSEIFPIILTLYFLEGQGRIVWEYASWSRIIFDALVFCSILKIFITNKKIIDSRIVPRPLILLILAHFFWYLVEFSNLHSLSYFAVFAASKVYIYPILFFLGLTQLDFDVEKENFQKCLTLLTVILIFELLLNYYQFDLKESFIVQISPYYNKVMRDGIFAGRFYRPFGTTQGAGTISIFLFLTIGLLFFKTSTKLNYLLRTGIILASGFVIILCQIRSAFIKFVLIVIAIHLGELLFFRFKAKGFVGITFLAIFIFIGTPFLKETKTNAKDEGITYATDRVLSLGDVNKLKDSRLDLQSFLRVAAEKLSVYPLGFGPGLTGPAASMSRDEMVGNRFINDDLTWTYDNLIISLVIDFGIGGIFYILVIVYIPAYFIRFLIKYYKSKSYSSYKVLMVCFCVTFVIILGNWGAIGLTYNPESFAFWFFAALGFATIAKHKELELIKNEQ